MTRSHLFCAAALLSAATSSPCADFAVTAVSYDRGTGSGGYIDPTAALGSPAPITGTATPYPGVLSVFNPPYEASQLTGVGSGGELTVQLANYVVVDRTGVPGIGIFSNVGLNDANYPNGMADSSASTLSSPATAVIEVSQNGTVWYALNGGKPLVIGVPTNYYRNGGPYDSAAPANPQYSDFGEPFSGGEAAFANENYSQILATLAGSAGGTWLALNGLPAAVTEIGYVRISGVPAGEDLKIDAISGNSALAAGVVPEAALSPALLLAAALLTLRRRQPSPSK